MSHPRRQKSLFFQTDEYLITSYFYTYELPPLRITDHWTCFWVRFSLRFVIHSYNLFICLYNYNTSKHLLNWINAKVDQHHTQMITSLQSINSYFVVVVVGGGGSKVIMNILMSWYSPNRPEAIHVWWERKYSWNIIEWHHVGWWWWCTWW